MPNIMMTYRCNLNCPYCFANEFVNKEANDISMDNFITALDFLVKDGSTYLGLIGGEPTLHSKFKEILNIIIQNCKIEECTIYTNGILLDRYFDEIASPKFRLLVNCNSPDIIGEEKFKHIVNNLEVLINQRYMTDRINIGVNFFDDDMDCSYIIDLLKRFDLHRVRLSLTVPDFGKCGKISSIEYFRKRKDGLFKLLHLFDENQIVPYYDCNKIPFCLWDEDEQNWLLSYIGKYGIKESNLIGNQSVCYPVIDILPDLKAVRCFGMSDFEKVRITDFNNITDIAAYFLNLIDSEAYHISPSIECKECYQRKTRHCTAGCIGFKADEIKRINSLYK